MLPLKQKNLTFRTKISNTVEDNSNFVHQKHFMTRMTPTKSFTIFTITYTDMTPTAELSERLAQTVLNGWTIDSQQVEQMQ